MKDFAKIASPITALTRDDADKVWSEDCQKAFDQLKKAMASKPILAHPDPNEPYVIQTDASAVAVSGILTQYLPTPEVSTLEGAGTGKEKKNPGDC